MLTARIVALIALTLAPALVIQAYNLHGLYAARVASVHDEARRQSYVIAADLGQFGETMRETLGILAEEPAIRARDAPACTAYLRAIGGKLPGAFLLAVAGPDGRIVCNTLGSAPGAYSLAERGYFQEAMRTGGFAVGEYVAGMVTRRPTVQFALTLRDDRGQPSGIVLASIDLDWLAQRLVGAGLAPDATLTVTDRNGVVLVRVPDAPTWVGRTLPPARIAALAAALAAGGTREAVALDGRTRIIGIRSASGALASFSVAVGIDREAAFADVVAVTRREIELMGLGALLALGGAFLAGRRFIKQPIERLAQTAAAWRSGDLNARTNLRGRTEFGRLGEAFDGMASALQTHEGELRVEIARSHELRSQQTTLLHELNHGVKNTLATVQSLARQSGLGQDRTGGAQDLEQRILALSKTHDLLTRDAWTGAPLREVLENELGPYRTEAGNVALEGPKVALPPRHVLALGMTVHELTTNAAKYGALSMEGGSVRVTWMVEPDRTGVRHLRLVWTESGGPPVAEPTRHGFGSRLIAGSMRRELAGEVGFDFARSGLTCTIRVPLPADLPLAANDAA